MKLERSTLEKLAHLSRLNFDEKDEQKMLHSLNDILDWVDKLQELNTENVEPLTHMSEEQNVWRPDQAKSTLDRENGLKNAPKRDEEYFRVPKVIE